MSLGDLLMAGVGLAFVGVTLVLLFAVFSPLDGEDE